MTMNTNENKKTAETADALDAFEQSWVDVLNQPEQPELPQPGDAAHDAAFIEGVLDRWERETRRPVLATIGWTPYAAAAALLLCAVVGWAVLRGQSGDTLPGSTPTPGAIAEEPEATQDVDPTPTRIAERTEDERRELARSLQLGTMIAGTSQSLAKPAAGLPKTLDDTADNFSLQGLARGLGSPVPDPNEALPPRRDTPRG